MIEKVEDELEKKMAKLEKKNERFEEQMAKLTKENHALKEEKREWQKAVMPKKEPNDHDLAVKSTREVNDHDLAAKSSNDGNITTLVLHELAKMNTNQLDLRAILGEIQGRLAGLQNCQKIVLNYNFATPHKPT